MFKTKGTRQLLLARPLYIVTKRRQSILVHQIVEERIKILVQSFQQFIVQHYDFLVIYIEKVFQCFFVIINKDEREGFHYCHLLNLRPKFFNTLTENRCHTCIEIILRIAIDPFLYHTTGKFIIIVVVDSDFATVGTHLHMQVCKYGFFSLWITGDDFP